MSRRALAAGGVDVVVIASAHARACDLPMSAHLETLRELLRRLLHLDQPELQLGVYRLANHRRDALERALADLLGPRVVDAVQTDDEARQVYAALERFFARCEREDELARADPHYVKSEQRLTGYAFALAGRVLRFERGAAPPQAAAAEGSARRLVLRATADALEWTGHRLRARFHELALPARRSQRELNAHAVARILEAAPPAWRAALTSTSGRRALARHIRAYTSRTSSDYLIHGDLSGLLRRELDRFLTLELVSLDALLDDDAGPPASARRVLRAARSCAASVIELLAGLESLQRRLWLKQRFVVESRWCVSLEFVPPELYGELAACETQRREWTALHGVDQLPGYSEPLTPAFLRDNPRLVLDTRNLGEALRERIIAALPARDERTSGVLIHADNFHGLRLCHARFGRSVRAVYIDPPYNTGERSFAYKDHYRRASWRALIESRARAAAPLERPDCATFVSIDDAELGALLPAYERLYGRDARFVSFVWQKRRSRENRRAVSVNHDYILGFARQPDAARVHLGRLPPTDELRARYKNPDDDPRGPWQSVSANAQAGHATASQFYAFTTPAGRVVEPPRGRCWIYTRARMQAEADAGRLWFGKDGAGVPRLKRYLSESKGLTPHTLWTADEVGTNDGAKRALLALLPGAPLVARTTPKPRALLERLLLLGCSQGELVLDYFAGTGTLGHAALELARRGEPRRFVLIEADESFDAVLVPRLKKAAYQGGAGAAVCMQLLRLERHDDTLDNLQLDPALDPLPPRAPDALGYRLDADGRPALAEGAAFRDPFSAALWITGARGGSRQAIDLVETFNLLLGLTVERSRARVDRRARFEHDEAGVLRIAGALEPCEPGEPERPWTVKAVEGREPDGARALILWRTCTGDAARDRLVLERVCAELGLDGATRATSFDRVYVNGPPEHASPRAQSVEEAVRRLMWPTT